MSIREMPFNDETCERPHAQFAAEHRHSNSSSFAWKSATVRLRQNLDDADALTAAINAPLQSLYDDCKAVIQTTRHTRSVRCTRAAFEQRMYRCSEHFEPVVVGDDDGDDAPLGPAGPAPQALADEASAASAGLRAEATGCKLMRHWLADAIPRYAYFSVQVEQPNDDVPLRCFQLLDAPRKLVLVNTYEDESEQHRLFNVQPFETWMPKGYNKAATTVDVCKVSDASELDLVGLLNGDVLSRSAVQIWEQAPSVVDGCISFANPKPATPVADMWSKSVPLLALWDTLEAREFMRVDKRVTHSTRSGKYYDDKRVECRSYLQAVLSSDWLSSMGRALSLLRCQRASTC